MLYPSLTLQKLLRPLLPLLEKVSPAKSHSTDAHQTSLRRSRRRRRGAVPLPRRLLPLRILPSFDERTLPWFDPRVRDTSQRDYDWLDKLWPRAWCSTRRSATSPSCSRWRCGCRSSSRRFPEAQILYMARDPLSMIPSATSLVVGLLDRGSGSVGAGDDARRWFDACTRRGSCCCRSSTRTGRPAHRQEARLHRALRPDDGGLRGMMDEMCAFLGHEMTPALRATVAKRGEKQRKYESEHKYDLEKFGLTEEQVRRDCKFFYDEFLPPCSEPARPGGASKPSLARRAPLADLRRGRRWRSGRPSTLKLCSPVGRNIEAAAYALGRPNMAPRFSGRVLRSDRGLGSGFEGFDAFVAEPRRNAGAMKSGLAWPSAGARRAVGSVRRRDAEPAAEGEVACELPLAPPR